MLNLEVLKERQKKEALKRMKFLKLHQNTISEFYKENKINYSENGVLFWLKDEWQKYVEAFEEKHNAKVYHVIHNNTKLGEMLSMLYVSSDEDEWPSDWEYLENNRVFAYVENLDAAFFSEIGIIGFKPLIGGLVRTF